MKKSAARAIPDEFLPLVEQGILNLAARGELRIIRDGVDITKSMLAQSGRVNKDYAEALNNIRNRRAVQRKSTSHDTPKMAQPGKPGANGIGDKPGPKKAPAKS